MKSFPDAEFGAALDTLHRSAVRKSRALATDALMAVFDQLPVELRKGLTSFPPPTGRAAIQRSVTHSARWH